MSDIVERLQDRAIVARNEGTGTGLGDAIHFEEAASTITALEARVRELEDELRAAIGYMTNASIDLETGATKKTALATINGGIKRARAALGEKP